MNVSRNNVKKGVYHSNYVTGVPTRNRGFSLIELMIAMVLGITVIGGAIAAFSSASRSAEFNQAISQLQANARFALDALSTDIRMAGHFGCASAERSQLSVSTSKSPVSNFSNTSLSAAMVGGTNWKTKLPTGYNPPNGRGEPVDGTYFIHVQYAATLGLALANDMMGRSSSLVVNGKASNLRAGELAVIANCDTGDLFEISAISGTGDQRTITPAESLAKPYLSDATTTNTTRVMPFVSSIYYIGNTTRVNEFNEPIRSLYLQTFPHDPDNNPPLEIIEGVDHLELDFGVWQDDNSIKYSSPDASFLSAQNISSIRIGLLMSSHSHHSNSSAERTYIVAGKTLVPDGSSTQGAGKFPNDKRIRIAFNSTIKVRNRFAENRQ